MVKIIVGILCLFILIAIFVFYLYRQIRYIKIKKQEIQSEKLKSDYKILHMTDIHSNPFADYRKIYRSILEEKPDFICITGDIIKDKDSDLNVLMSFLNKLMLIEIPIYFVYGNHDYRNESKEKVKNLLNFYGIKVLVDEIVDFKEDLQIVGYEYKTHLSELKSEDSEKFILSLLHDPMHIVYSKEKSDLFLCGHTHGGQIRFPLIGALYAPSQALFPRLQRGIYTLEHGPVYISSGIGYSVIPIRFLNPSEMTYIYLRTK